MTTSKTKSNILIKKARLEDSNNLIDLINALADYEKLERPNSEAQTRLLNDIFGSNPKINVYIAEVENKIVAYAITCYIYSSFLALSTLYLEDIFVLPEYRSFGIGKELFKHCAKMALAEGCGRMEWQVLDWNKLAIDFYKKIGAKQMKEWLPYRFTREELEKLIS